MICAHTSFVIVEPLSVVVVVLVVKLVVAVIISQLTRLQHASSTKVD